MGGELTGALNLVAFGRKESTEKARRAATIADRRAPSVEIAENLRSPISRQPSEYADSLTVIGAEA